jgi:hypothetical protein
MSASAASFAGSVKESTSFLKKRSKRLFLIWAWGFGSDTALGPRLAEVFAPLFSKSGYFLLRPTAM